MKGLVVFLVVMALFCIVWAGFGVFGYLFLNWGVESLLIALFLMVQGVCSLLVLRRLP